MEKFDIKKMYGFSWMVISLSMLLLIFIFFLGFMIYLKVITPENANKDAVNNVFVVLIIIDSFSAICFIGSLIGYLHMFLPFKNAKGKVIDIKISEKDLFNTMYGEIESENVIIRVKIRFVSRLAIDYFASYKVGDYARCFVREQDLDMPKIAVLYR